MGDAVIGPLLLAFVAGMATAIVGAIAMLSEPP